MVKLEEPDKGRAWVVAFAACIINMILSGLSRMVGMLYVAVLKEYDTTREMANMPFTTRNAIRLLAGPVVGIVGQRFGIRTVTFWGGVIASAGAALCYVAPSVGWLTVFWGGMHGIGFAFANTLFQVAVNQYFKKYRATASGIALSGACLGSLGFPFMIEAILETFGLSGTFLILGGIVMNVLPPSLMLTVPQWVQYPESYARLWAKQNPEKSARDSIAIEKAETTDPDSDPRSFRNRVASITSLENCPIEVMTRNFEIMSRESRTDYGRSVVKFKYPMVNFDRQESAICILYSTRESPPMDRRYSVQNGDFQNGVNWKNSLNGNIALPLEQVNIPSAEKTGEKDESVTKQLNSPVKKRQSFKEILVKTVTLYKNPFFILISMCMCTYIIIFIPILTVIVDYSSDKGIPQSAGKYLLNAMAIGDLVGRLGFGWVTDKKYMTVQSFLALVLMLAGVFIALFPLANSLAAIVTLLVLYSVTAGSVLILFPILVSQYVDENSQSIGMANVGFISGLLSFAIPSMIGHFRDNNNSYDGMFYLIGGISIATGVMWILEPLLQRIFRRTPNV